MPLDALGSLVVTLIVEWAEAVYRIGENLVNLLVCVSCCIVQAFDYCSLTARPYLIRFERIGKS